MVSACVQTPLEVYEGIFGCVHTTQSFHAVRQRTILHGDEVRQLGSTQFLSCLGVGPLGLQLLYAAVELR